MSLFALDDEICQEITTGVATPLFVYDEAAARQSYQALRLALPSRVRLAYAVKANGHPRLLEFLASLGASFDCASMGEMRRVSRIGIRGERLLFSGPAKRGHEIARALELGGRVQIENLQDALVIDRLARARVHRGPVRVNLRIHPMSGIAESKPLIGGIGPSAFGIDEERLEEAVEFCDSRSRLQVRGLHVFAASNELSADRLLKNYTRVFEIAERLSQLLPEPLEQIDLGGGLGIPYQQGEELLDTQALGRGLSELLQRNSWFQGEILLEPGRFLAGPCGMYLSRIVRVKESRGTRFVLLEAGINHLLRPLLTGQPFPVKVVGRTGATRPATLAGPLCTSLDRLGEVSLPEVEPGDLVAFGQCGAYGRSEAMPQFLDHPEAGELWRADSCNRLSIPEPHLADVAGL